jgi:hypothetical protein
MDISQELATSIFSIKEKTVHKLFYETTGNAEVI